MFNCCICSHGLGLTDLKPSIANQLEGVIMKFADPRLMILENEIRKVANHFSLDPDHLLVESFVPNGAAVLVETVGEHRVRLHINLQENRIVSAKELDSNCIDRELFKKYLEHMR